MQPINYDELARNRDWLVAWQKQQWNRKADGIRLHLGSGHVHMEGYINVDPYTEESDLKEDMSHLSFKANTVLEIVCHHALEHIPIRDVWATLNHWYNILVSGGTIEIGIPDLELCCQEFLEASEQRRWTHCIWYLYGGQTTDNNFTPVGNKYDIRDNLPFSLAQVHKNGYSLGYFVRTLEDIGFRIIKTFNYDANGCAPSIFVYAEKPDNHPLGNILEQDTVIGTFTNKTTYLEELWKSAYEYIPKIKFITRIQRGPINIGMTLLREDFIKSGKRYWVFLDDDIRFLNSDIISNALKILINNKAGAVSVYSTFEPSSLTSPYNPIEKGCTERLHKWATGYFIMVDSKKVGHILPDMNLPDGNTAVDTSYSAVIRREGYDIFISPDYVYHVKKQVWAKPDIIKITNNYLTKKWGQFYYDVAKYDFNVIDDGWRKEGCLIK